MSIRHSLLAVVVASFVTACGGGSNNPNSPSAPTTATRATLGATMTATGERISGGYSYEISIRVSESAGVGARIASADVTFFDGGASFGTAHFDNPMNATDRVEGNGTAQSKSLTVTDDRAGTTYATRVEARLAYTDDTQFTGAVTAAASIPGLPAPPPSGTLTLSGTVKSGSALLSGVLLEVVAGPNAGRSAATGSNGKYSLGNLASGSLSVRASKSGYVTEQKQVTLTSNRTLDLSLSKSSGGGGGGGGGGDDGGGDGGGDALTCGSSTVPSVVDCPNDQGRKAPTAQCDDGSYSCSQNRSGTCSHHGGVACWVCPGPLCSGILAPSDLSLGASDWVIPEGNSLRATVNP